MSPGPSPGDGAPLSGVRVVAVEQSVAGPLASRILADLGADVVKVEPPGGDFARSWDTHVLGESAQFWWLNRRKDSVVLDLRTPEGRTRLDDLLADADVLVHNASPAAAERLGLGPGLLERFPRLVNCQISGFGAGPDADPVFRDRKAYDLLVQAESGVMSLTGTPEQPARTGVSIADVSTGLYAALLVLAALLERDRSGRGRHLDVAMIDATAEFVGPMLLSRANAGVRYPRSLDRHHAIAPYGVFRCAGGHPLVVACHQDAEWRRLADVLLGDAALGTDPRFRTNTDRLAHRDEVDGLVAAALGRLDPASATATLDAAGIAWADLRDIGEVVEHPALTARGAFAEVPTADDGSATTLVGLAERAFGLRPRGRLRPPRPDERG